MFLRHLPLASASSKCGLPTPTHSCCGPASSIMNALMEIHRIFGAALCAISLVSVALPAPAQTAQQRSLYERYTEPIQLFTTGLGTFTKPISSSNKEAQAFFDQGFQMMYAFAKQDAVRSFREAWKRDPDCAICYWGEAWAWGSYLNAPMNAEEAPHAYAAAQKAQTLKSRATAKERELIDAMAVRYVEKFDPAK